MSDFKAKMHQIRFLLGFCPGPSGRAVIMWCRQNHSYACLQRSFVAYLPPGWSSWADNDVIASDVITASDAGVSNNGSRWLRWWTWVAALAFASVYLLWNCYRHTHSHTHTHGPEWEVTEKNRGGGYKGVSMGGCVPSPLNFQVKTHGFIHFYCTKLLVARNLDRGLNRPPGGWRCKMHRGRGENLVGVSTPQLPHQLASWLTLPLFQHLDGWVKIEVLFIVSWSRIT